MNIFNGEIGRISFCFNCLFSIEKSISYTWATCSFWILQIFSFFWILQIDLKEDLRCELLQNELWSDSKYSNFPFNNSIQNYFITF